MTHEQREVKDGLLQFMVKDQDYFGMSSEFLGEAYVPFSEIASTTMETGLEEMAQIHLKLSKPVNLGKWFILFNILIMSILYCFKSVYCNS